MWTFEVIEDYVEIPGKEELISAIGQQMRGYGADPDPLRINASLQNALSEGKRARLFLVLNETHTVIGFAFGNICSGLESGGDYLWINELFITPAYRKQHIARQLLYFIEKWVKDFGIVYVACSTGTTNEVAQKLYSSCGYEISPTLWVDKSLTH